MRRNHVQPCVLCDVWYGVGCDMCSVGCCELHAVSCVMLYVSGISIPLYRHCYTGDRGCK